MKFWHLAALAVAATIPVLLLAKGDERTQISAPVDPDDIFEYELRTD